MIIMNVKLDNLYGFKDFDINFSYPRKLNNSSVPFEYLKEKPNFRFKRVNILMGANASGKTTFGKALMTIFNFLSKKNISFIYDDVSDKKKNSSFEIDFVLEESKLYRVYCKVLDNSLVELNVYKSDIRKSDSYDKASERLTLISSLSEINDDELEEFEMTSQTLKELEKGAFGWYFCFPNKMIEESAEIDIKILDAILRTFDPSISEVKESSEVENSFIITFKDGKKVMVTKGSDLEKTILSSGTQEAISIASTISTIKSSSNRPFYIDEKFSHAHTELEVTILSTIIEMISPKAQLFFTGHNTDLLEMNLPIHSFTFFKKTDKIEVIYPSEILNKNDRSLVNAVKNDVFNTIPDVDFLTDSLMEW